MRGAHVEHAAHVRDAGRVEAERLVERRRALPSRKAGVRCGARCGLGGGRGMGRRQRTSGMHGERARLCEGWGGYRACAKRTPNMLFMSVTLDVTKLSGWLNAAADCRVERRAYDAERGVGRGREGVGRRQRTSGMHGENARL